MKDTLLKFYKKIENYKDINYLLAVLKLNVSPTKMGIKASTLINISNMPNRSLTNVFSQNINSIVDTIGLEYKILKCGSKNIVVLFYDYDMLKAIIDRPKEKEYLFDLGYRCSSLEEYLEELTHRFEDYCPNELGVFLDYPLEDVKSYNAVGRKCKLVGYWKCYHDEEKARAMFDAYERCKLNFIEAFI